MKNTISISCIILCMTLLGGCVSTGLNESSSSSETLPSSTTFTTSATVLTNGSLPSSTTATTPTNETAPSTSTTPTTGVTIPITATQTTVARSKVLLNVPTIHQFPEYPTGCESVAAVMALRYAGENTSVANFIDNHLKCSQNFYWWEGKFYGPSPYEHFLGNPRTDNSYGCMAPVIEDALVSFLGSRKRVKNTTGQSLDALCKTYLNNDTPVLVWASIGMVNITDGRQWILPDGTPFTWPSNEHCLLLVGYDANKYYFNDPYRGTLVTYARSVVEDRYNRLGKQSLVVTK